MTTKLAASGPTILGGLNVAGAGDRFVTITVRSGVTDPSFGAPPKSSRPVEREMVTVGVAVGVAVTVAVDVAVAVRVAVAVAVAVRVAVAVAVGVLAVAVAVAVAVLV